MIFELKIFVGPGAYISNCSLLFVHLKQQPLVCASHYCSLLRVHLELQSYLCISNSSLCVHRIIATSCACISNCSLLCVHLELQPLVCASRIVETCVHHELQPLVCASQIVASFMQLEFQPLLLASQMCECIWNCSLLRVHLELQPPVSAYIHTISIFSLCQNSVLTFLKFK